MPCRRSEKNKNSGPSFFLVGNISVHHLSLCSVNLNAVPPVVPYESLEKMAANNRCIHHGSHPYH